jgi:hypothetical protein
LFKTNKKIEKGKHFWKFEKITEKKKLNYVRDFWHGLSAHHFLSLTYGSHICLYIFLFCCLSLLRGLDHAAGPSLPQPSLLSPSLSPLSSTPRSPRSSLHPTAPAATPAPSPATRPPVLEPLHQPPMEPAPSCRVDRASPSPSARSRLAEPLRAVEAASSRDKTTRTALPNRPCPTRRPRRPCRPSSRNFDASVSLCVNRTLMLYQWPP